MKKNILIKDRLKRILIINIISYIVFYIVAYLFYYFIVPLLSSNNTVNLECQIGFVNCLLSFEPLFLAIIMSANASQVKIDPNIKNKNILIMCFTKLFLKLLIIHTLISLFLYYIVYGSILAIEAIFDMSLRC